MKRKLIKIIEQNPGGGDESGKYSWNNVPKNIHPNNLRPSDFISEDDYIKFFTEGRGKGYNCGTTACAKFANDYAGFAAGLTGKMREDWSKQGNKILSGHAWQSYGHVLSTGGKSKYNAYKKEGDLNSLKPGDIVGLKGKWSVYDRSIYPTKGQDKPLAGVDNSHMGVVDFVDSKGNVWVRHNIAGKVALQKIDKTNNGYYVGSWKVVTAAQPNWGAFNPDFKYDEKTQTWTLDPYISDYNPNNLVDIQDKFYEMPGGDFSSNPIIRSQQIKEYGTENQGKLRKKVNLQNDKMHQALVSLNANKKALMDYYRMSEADFNELAKHAIATIGVESRFGTSPKEEFKSNNPGLVSLAKGDVNDWIGSLNAKPEKRKEKFGKNSVGIGQVKPYSIDPLFESTFGLTTLKDYKDPGKNILAVFSHLYDDRKKAERWADRNTDLKNEELRNPNNLAYGVYNAPRTVLSGNLTPHPDDPTKYANQRLRLENELAKNVPLIINTDDAIFESQYSNLKPIEIVGERRYGGNLLKYKNGGNISSPEDQKSGLSGMIKARIAYADAFGNPSAKRMVRPTNNPYVFKGDEPYTTPDMAGGGDDIVATVNLPAVAISAQGNQYPYYGNLTQEELKYFDQNNPLGRYIRSLAATGKRKQTAEEITNILGEGLLELFEVTGVPGAIRFGKDPIGNLRGAGNTIVDLGMAVGSTYNRPLGFMDYYNNGINPITGEQPFRQEDVDKAFNTLNALGLISKGVVLFKQPLRSGLKQAGKYLTSKTPLKNAYKLNPWTFKPNPEAFYKGVGKEGGWLDNL